jgi:hypothetical protein
MTLPSEKPPKLRGDGGGALSFEAPFVLEETLFAACSLAMEPRGYARLTALINVR